MADEPIEIGYYGAVVRRYRLAIAGVAVVFGLAAAVALRSSGWEARADVLVQPITAPGSTAVDVQPDRLINTLTEREVASSTAVANLAAQSLGVEDARSLRRRLTVAVTPDTQVLSFRFRAGSAEGAIDGAQAFAEAYLDYRRSRAEQTRQERIEALQQELDESTAALIDANVVVNRASDGDSGNDPTSRELAEAQSRRDLLISEISSLNSDLADLREQRIVPGEVIAPATDATPTGTSRIVLFAVGAGVGAMLTAAAAFVLDRLRARVNLPEEAAADLGAPVLATVPPSRRASQVLVTLSEPRAPAAHAYRRLAVALTSDPDRPLRWVLVVAPTRAEPATAVVVNLGVALQQQGKRVLLVSADRHDSGVDRTFGLTGEVGFDAHLAGAATVPPREVLSGMHVLPAGTGDAFPVDHMPPPRRVAAVLERGRRLADIVLVEAPPALDYSDAEAIAPLVDAVLVVAAAERTPRRVLAELRARLDLVQAPVRGAVLVQEPRLEDHLLAWLRRLRDRVASGRAPRRQAPAGAAAVPDDPAVLKARVDELLGRHPSSGTS